MWALPCACGVLVWLVVFVVVEEEEGARLGRFAMPRARSSSDSTYLPLPISSTAHQRTALHQYHHFRCSIPRNVSSVARSVLQ